MRTSVVERTPATLLAEAQAAYQRPVPGGLHAAEVAQQPTPLSHELHEAALGVMVLPMHPQVLRQLANAFRQQPYRDIRGSTVRRVQTILGRQFFRLRLCEHSFTRPAPSSTSPSGRSIAHRRWRRQRGDDILALGNLPGNYPESFLMAKVAIVTDSSACLPSGLVEKYGIIIVPLAFLFDGQLHHDGSLSSQAFYEQLRGARRFPTTTAPAPGEFLEAFRRAREGGAGAVLCLTLASTYSGTYSSAANARELAAQELPGPRCAACPRAAGCPGSSTGRCPPSRSSPSWPPTASRPEGSRGSARCRGPRTGCCAIWKSGGARARPCTWRGCTPPRRPVPSSWPSASASSSSRRNSSSPSAPASWASTPARASWA